jgi:hypothetical protein
MEMATQTPLSSREDVTHTRLDHLAGQRCLYFGPDEEGTRLLNLHKLLQHEVTAANRHERPYEEEALEKLPEVIKV